MYSAAIAAPFEPARRPSKTGLESHSTCALRRSGATAEMETIATANVARTAPRMFLNVLRMFSFCLRQRNQRHDVGRQSHYERHRNAPKDGDHDGQHR